ncbi:similar to Saccharomyces cerevisiae YDL087C LUC7 Essential protein associated with the U1 snRNP complex [Maudiozyma barnettii]|uniref:Similar to Saccharomyces cerevisiae YDL087C LUC7 Essential protein associated with the U1 snRNP complex n=1 Tax=Maudiozyma barnettii TaxID=61262 RepID=A0A8H2ZKL2_9SACH|nr:Luc7p [Kazachstania barnettii]CAB4257088.1 similar to Saccharomyces cerevisiae YDL087C LUC7 Essential protein associated with the U1 snRNP complex [Kazachstania barnettii]CAD1779459.1 similar to Saccharomyces cerevisiae YDL087C LUC7 Essential protein associated with the U1 snRNP complex [Kazachstania barnettii]
MGTPAAEQRKLIEQLMGKDIQSRFGGRSRYYQQNLGIRDRRVCKSYLVGDCPYDLFQGTKQSLGTCPQLHLSKYKLQYDRDIANGKRYPEFEREYYLVLAKFVHDCNDQIEVALKNLEHTSEERERIKTVTKELDDIDTQIGLMMQEIESLTTHNEVSKAIMQSVKLEEMQERRQVIAKNVKNITENVGQSAQQKLQVCEVCGAYLSRLDTDRRLADHFLGKIHLGYVRMREHYQLFNKQTDNKI